MGLPKDSPDNVVNVDVGNHWKGLDENASQASGNWSHSWHFDDKVFAEDLFHTIQGDIDRNRIPTRKLVNGELILQKY